MPSNRFHWENNFLEVQRDNCSEVRTDRTKFTVLAPLPQEYDGMWKPKDCDLLVLGLCEDIFVTAGSMRTLQNWMRVKAFKTTLPVAG